MAKNMRQFRLMSSGKMDSIGPASQPAGAAASPGLNARPS